MRAGETKCVSSTGKLRFRSNFNWIRGKRKHAREPISAARLRKKKGQNLPCLEQTGSVQIASFDSVSLNLMDRWRSTLLARSSDR